MDPCVMPQRTCTAVWRKATLYNMGFHTGRLLTSSCFCEIPANVRFRPARTPCGGSLVNLMEDCRKTGGRGNEFDHGPFTKLITALFVQVNPGGGGRALEVVLTCSSVMEKRLCGSVVIQTRNVSCGASTVVIVSSSSSINSRPRWQFCRSTQPPCTRGGGGTHQGTRSTTKSQSTPHHITPAVKAAHLRHGCLNEFPRVHLLSLAHGYRSAVCKHNHVMES